MFRLAGLQLEVAGVAPSQGLQNQMRALENLPVIDEFRMGADLFPFSFLSFFFLGGGEGGFKYSLSNSLFAWAPS